MTKQRQWHGGGWLLLLALLAPEWGHARTATLVADVNTSAAAYDPSAITSSAPRDLAAVGESMLFVADEASSGTEIWVSDGTALGTHLLVDICPGRCSSSPRRFATLGRIQLWVAFRAQGSPAQIWRTDGTRAGTFPLSPSSLYVVDEVEPYGPHFAILGNALYFQGCTEESCRIWRTDGSAPAQPLLEGRWRDPVVAGGVLYFFRPETDGVELWKSNGTPAGTSLVEVLPPNWIRHVTMAAGRLFFVVGSSELWTSDGTADGTRLVKRFEAGEALLDTQWLKAAGSRVYFVANDILHGEEIWRSDGTPTGTLRVTDFGVYHPFGGLERDALAVFGERLLFRASDGLVPYNLWVSQGTPESTAPFLEACSGCRFDSPLVAAGSRVLFAFDGGLWVSDGTRNGTRRLRSFLGNPLFVSDRLFVAEDAALGLEIWTSDGTAAGTRPLTQMPAGGRIRLQEPEIAAVGERLFFQGGDGAHGLELWMADALGTRLVHDVARHAPGSAPEDLTAVGNRLFWTGCDGARRALFSSGGSPETTAAVPGTDNLCWDGPHSLIEVGGRLFYLQQDESWNFEIGTSDGTGSTLLTDLNRGSYPLASGLLSLGGELHFAVRDDTRIKLWKSDGTRAGTSERFALPPGSGEPLTPLGGEIYFWSFSLPSRGLWRSDGSEAGTRLVANGLRPPDRVQFARVGSAVFFLATAQDDWRTALYRTGGTPETTTAIVLAESLTPVRLASAAGHLYLLASGLEGWSVWRLNEAGTEAILLHELALPFDPAGQPRFELVPFAGKVFFAADDGTHGLELWATDGTPGGTALVADLAPGEASSSPRELTVAGGRLFFVADDGRHGSELWRSDGTAAGTLLVEDLAPQELSSDPQQLTPAGDHLFLTADDGLSGREVWAVSLTASACQPSPRRLCLNQGRFQIEALWHDFSGRQGRGTAVPLSADTGYFWFFGPDNVEAVLKVLDGRGVNDHFWVFYGALSNVEYILTVTDTTNGLTRRYFNPSGQFASLGDTTAFGPRGASRAAAEPIVAPASPAPETAERSDPGAKVGGCQASSTRLCLQGGRFAVEVAWKDFSGNTGVGTAVPLTSDTGTFWFFDPANIELVLKVLDGRPVTGKYWVFYGALSSVEYTITVTDTQSGAVKTYRNPSGRLASVGDTGAF